MDFVDFLRRSEEFSLRTFGPAKRTAGILAHIRKEVDEVEKDPYDLVEWIDIVLLARDGARRHGGTPESIAETLERKFLILSERSWPDWRTVSEGSPIEHVRV